MKFRRIASLKTPEDFRDALRHLNLVLPFDTTVEHGPSAPLARPLYRHNLAIGNRFAILPMEGWDGIEDGRPSDLTFRRWERFGISGAKLIWGGEAVAVRHDGRANPNQLLINEANLSDLARLRERLESAHLNRFGCTDDLLIGLQLTHSGRFSRPNDKKRLEPTILYRHPYLDKKFPLDDSVLVMTDDEISRLIEEFVRAAKQSQRAGFAFVDVKCCHGYLGHEFLSAVERPGRYGGSFENRTRFLSEVVKGIHAEAPGLQIGVRVSIFDFLPFRTGADGRGEPTPLLGPSYPYAFGGNPTTGLEPDLTESSSFLDLLEALKVPLVCTTAGNPYTNPHILRPATFPPSDGYLPPEDPLVGVARQVAATAWLKARHPDLIVVGSAYSYLQDWLPNVAQAVVREGAADSIGIGRMVLSYPELPADVLEGRPLARKSICRTFSDCTSGPRNGVISGCYPLDPFYKNRPERSALPRHVSGST